MFKEFGWVADVALRIKPYWVRIKANFMLVLGRDREEDNIFQAEVLDRLNRYAQAKEVVIGQVVLVISKNTTFLENLFGFDAGRGDTFYFMGKLSDAAQYLEKESPHKTLIDLDGFEKQQIESLLQLYPGRLGLYKTMCVSRNQNFPNLPSVVGDIWYCRLGYYGGSIESFLGNWLKPPAQARLLQTTGELSQEEPPVQWNKYR